LIDCRLLNRRVRQLHFQDAADVSVATGAPNRMAADLFTKVLNGIIFVGVLRNVCGELVVEVFGYKLTVPKYLVITVVTCASTIWMRSYPACRAPRC
jgi:ABC-type uncharacterized transport system fused permease/ATPase subunit